MPARSASSSRAGASSKAERTAPARAGRSLLWASLAAALGFLLLIALGTWQVERLFWKEALIAERHAAVTAPPIALPPTLAAARVLQYHHVAATGTFLHDRELYLGATSEEGQPGYHIITPLLLENGDILLVDRGFVPQQNRAPATRLPGELKGTVRVTGLLRVPPEGRPHWFLPENNAARNYWLYVDIPAMAAATHLDRVLPFYIDADATPNPGGLPVGGQTRLDLPNNHLQYAITWYALAAGLAAIATIAIRRKAQEGSA